MTTDEFIVHVLKYFCICVIRFHCCLTNVTWMGLFTIYAKGRKIMVTLMTIGKISGWLSSTSSSSYLLSEHFMAEEIHSCKSKPSQMILVALMTVRFMYVIWLTLIMQPCPWNQLEINEYKSWRLFVFFCVNGFHLMTGWVAIACYCR